MDFPWVYGTFGMVAAYLCGSIPTSVWWGRAFHGVDVREHGSKNAGATNTFRVLGARAGIPVLLIDILKGFLPVYLGKQLGMGESVLSLLALCAVLGHVFTPWLKFQGGKGVATALGVALAFRAAMILPALGVFVVLLLVFRYVSLGSVMAALTLLAVLIWKGATPVVLLLWADIVLIVVAKHHENIRRLLKGTESPLWGAKKEQAHG